jgi:hypothetical protein
MGSTVLPVIQKYMYDKATPFPHVLLRKMLQTVGNGVKSRTKNKWDVSVVGQSAQLEVPQ